MKKRNLYFLFLLVLFVQCVQPTKEQSLEKSNPYLKLENGILYFQEKAYYGSILSHYKEGTLASQITYVEGRKHGEEKKWHSNGVLAEKRFYTDGVKTGIHKGWWDNKTPQFEYHFNSQGQYNGFHKEWYASGQIYKDFNYVNGKEDGKQRLWKPDGRIKANYEVVYGERYGLIGLKRCKTVNVNSNQIK
ncbi:hypothetical protein [uncultured Maribacter sp.]|uniref:toxin-antitoxin system YwqK family antitoxin n=1 Tax=uncultured Maribacter sp. TaxID=431308 RepID=UPI002630A114|nr:hypothetical protein [uncultured Maribacter sp.]